MWKSYEEREREESSIASSLLGCSILPRLSQEGAGVFFRVGRSLRVGSSSSVLSGSLAGSCDGCRTARTQTAFTWHASITGGHFTCYITRLGPDVDFSLSEGRGDQSPPRADHTEPCWSLELLSRSSAMGPWSTDCRIFWMRSGVAREPTRHSNTGGRRPKYQFSPLGPNLPLPRITSNPWYCPLVDFRWEEGKNK